jgi:hypothetical protein
MKAAHATKSKETAAARAGKKAAGKKKKLRKRNAAKCAHLAQAAAGLGGVARIQVLGQQAREALLGLFC